MIKVKDKRISVYRGDYRPVEIFKNVEKLHGFQTVGLAGDESFFENTYNDGISVYGKSCHTAGKNLCPCPDTASGTFEDSGIYYDWSVTARENGYFDYSGYFTPGGYLAKMKLSAGTYTASGCEYASLWWDTADDFLPFPATFTLDAETEVYVYFWYTGSTLLTLTNQYIQVEKGDSATAYTPYIGNGDFPVSPDNQRKINFASGEIRVEGANFLPPDFGNFGEWPLKTADTPKDGFVFNLDLIPGEYLLSFNVTTVITSGTYGYLYIQESTDGGKNYKTTYQLVQFRNLLDKCFFTVKENVKYRVWAWQSMPERVYLFSDWALQRTDIPEGRYPYFPSYNFICPELEGIKVDEEDNYNYCEEVNGEKYYYISNALSRDKVKKSVGETVLTGQETFLQKEIEDLSFNCYYCDISHVIKRNRNADKFICNYFECLDAAETQKVGAVLGQNDTNIYFFVEKTKFQTLESFVNWVKSAKQNERGVKLYYILDTPITEPSGLEGSLCSYPQYTRIILKNSGDLKLGLSQCIKLQQKYDS